MKFIVSVLILANAVAAAGFSQAESSSRNQWIRAEKSDAFSGAKYSEFTLQGTFLTAPQKFDGGPPTIILKCQQGEHHNGKNIYGGRLLSAELFVGSVLSSVSLGVPVMYRLDDGQAKTEVWSVGTAGTAVFFNDITLNTLLYTHFLPHRENTNPPVKKLVVAIDEAFAGRIVMQFDLPAPVVVEDVCGVTYHKP